MITTRFYDGDPSNNVLFNQEAQKSKIVLVKGVIDKLDYIKALGFTAIWITPVVQNASGYDYHGYHAMDFSKVDYRAVTANGDVMYHQKALSRSFLTSCSTTPVTSVRRSSARCSTVILIFVTKHTLMLV